MRRIALFDQAERRAEVDLSVLSDDFSFVAVLKQDRLESILTNQLAMEDIKVKWSHRLAWLETQAEHVDVTINRLDKESLGYALAHTTWVVAGSKDYEVPFVIGCDGHKSLVRRRLDIDFPEIAPAQHFAVFECTTDYDFDHEMRIMLNEGDANAVWPLPDGHCRFSFEMPGYDHPEDERFKNRLMVELGSGRYPILEEGHLEELIDARAPWFDGRIEDIDWRLVVRFERRLAERFGAGRVWLAGDAAHMTSPVGIQSMNVGLREGHQLGLAIAGALQNGDRAALDAYEADRQAEWRKLHGLDGEITADAGADPWLSRRAAAIRTGLPASGSDLAALAGQLGFRI